MKKEKLISGIMVFAFLLILFAPIFTLNRIKGAISENENRKLAEFPQIFDESGALSEGLKSGFETWLNDNIGFRDLFLDIAAQIKVHGFHISTSDKVHIGKDGWYFYTLDNNLEIASGEYPLTEDTLKDIAEKQQAISDYYQTQGTEYILVLTPSKASVYPEYIGGADYQVGASPCDIVEDYLREHTDVQVINVKPANVAGKKDGQQFLKTDTHWSELGSYTAYREILTQLNDLEILNNEPIQVKFEKANVRGEFSAMLGSKTVLPMETTMSAEWDMQSEFIDEGPWFEEIDQLCKNNSDSKNYDTIILENRSIAQGTLLIYGDSQWGIGRNIPQLLAEGFRNVISIRMRSPNIVMDQTVKPDVVFFGCSERFINSILTRDLNIPNVVVRLPNLPERPAQTADYWIARQGLCIDSYNGTRIGGDATGFQIDRSSQQISLVGWAADFAALQPLSALYLQVGDQIVKCNYGIERTSVSDHFQNIDLKDTGFSVTFPASYLKDGQVEEIRFIQIGADGTYCYEPITYQLGYT